MKLSTFLSIINWRKLVYLIILQFLFKICFLYNLGFETTMSFFSFSLLSIATVSMLAAGYLISYYNKHKEDKLLEVTAKKAYSYGVISAFISAALGMFISFYIGKPYHSLIGIITAGLLLFYLHYNPERGFFNIVLGPCIKAISIFIVWWFDTPINASDQQWEIYFNFQLIAVFYIALSVVGNIVHQIIIDIGNINEDFASKTNTLPVLLGRRRAKSIALFLTIIGCIFVLGFAVTCIENKFILSIILFMGTIPELCLIYFIMNAHSEKDFKKVLKVSSVVYLLTIISIPLVAYYFRYVS
ncbi:UbiA family prenyltransferase [Tenacibaculum xiamenense]|uniref:UbiA family prenyltransferase n=1 Tax=Tenacibaculum xiamenense TaxID=1261553 RepID=UPI00389605C8